MLERILAAALVAGMRQYVARPDTGWLSDIVPEYEILERELSYLAFRDDFEVQEFWERACMRGMESFN